MASIMLMQAFFQIGSNTNIAAAIFLTLQDINVVHIVIVPRRTTSPPFHFGFAALCGTHHFAPVNILSIPRIIVVRAPRSTVVIDGAKWCG